MTRDRTDHDRTGTDGGTETDGTGTAQPRLTDHAELHGCSCKVGRGELEQLLAEAGLGGARNESDELLFGVGEDAAARPLTDDLALVQTVDFFTPIVDDPYDFGRVAACNAASDAFAAGATENLSCLAVLGVPRDLTDCAADVLAGMADALAEMDGVVAGGHTTLNPWPLAGGAVTATGHPDDLLTTQTTAPGDRLYLTKPLGTQPAMGALRTSDGEFAGMVEEAVDRPLEAIAGVTLDWMTTPNRDAARVAREHATAATDVTGFGLLGQARVLAENAGVGVEITRLPVVEGTPALSRLFGYGLEDGESAETSGGLLLATPDGSAEAIEAGLADAGVFFRRVGRVTGGDTHVGEGEARLVDPEIESIPATE